MPVDFLFQLGVHFGHGIQSLLQRSVARGLRQLHEVFETSGTHFRVDDPQQAQQIAHGVLVLDRRKEELVENRRAEVLCLKFVAHLEVKSGIFELLSMSNEHGPEEIPFQPTWMRDVTRQCMNGSSKGCPFTELAKMGSTLMRPVLSLAFAVCSV